MHIGIDARMYGIHNRGIGRYVERLLSHLAEISDNNRYTVFINQDAADSLKLPAGKFKIIIANIPWYGLAEQYKMPRLIRKSKVEAMHFPHWNAPYFCPVPFVVTIHDLLLLHFPGERATTLPKWQYQLKLRFAKLLIQRTAKRAKHIITISNFTKRDIIRHLHIKEEKITVTYLGADKMLLGSERLPNTPAFDNYLSNSFGIKKPYLLYVGSAYPHKNLENLCRAFALLRNQYQRQWQLLLVGRQDYFYQQLQKWVKSESALSQVSQDIIFTGEVSDKDLDGLYRGARIFVFPSLYEGFGLPPLEALVRGVPCAIAKTSSLPEILSDAAYYFDPENPEAMAASIDTLASSRSLQEELINKGFERVARFSWKDMAKDTVAVYKTL